MERFEIKRARETDLAVLLSLVLEYYAFDEIAFDANAVRRGLHELLADDSLGAAWLLHLAGTAVGCLVATYGFDLELGGRQATVTELFLRSIARRAGLGTAALQTLEHHLAERGIAAYELQVERDNREARAFYERRGFISQDRIPLTKRIGVGTGPCDRVEPDAASVVSTGKESSCAPG